MTKFFIILRICLLLIYLLAPFECVYGATLDINTTVSTCSVNGKLSIGTMRFGFTLQALCRKRSVLPLRGGSIITTSSFSPLSATRSRKSLASSAKKAYVLDAVSLRICDCVPHGRLVEFHADHLPALREAAMPMVPTPQ